jgi:hypothetical protein
MTARPDPPDDPGLDPALAALARRYVWWLPAEEALARPERLLRQILRLGTPEDYVAARARFGEAAFRDALENAGPGEIDDRSWLFWRRHYGLPDRPPPRRRFG